VEIGFTVRELVPGEGDVEPSSLPAGEVAVTLHRGPYERLPEALAALQDWIREHGRRAAGPHWEMYLNGPPDVMDPEELETEVFIPLEE
jgi:effector-binding domain-containing protein